MIKRMCLTVAAMVLAACSSNKASAPPASALSVQTFTSGDASNDVTSTLILGDKEAVLVDAQFVDSEAKKLVALIQGTRRHLSSIYVTHAHPDHHFGLAVLRAAFPDARVIAHPAVAAEMKSTWQGKHDYWKTVYGADVTDVEVDATPYAESAISLEGHELRLLGPAEGDIPDEVAVFVPELGTLITGDVSYGGTHVWLADTKPAQWDAWVANLESLAALKPTVVVPGHRDASRASDAASLTETAEYVRAFKAAVAAGRSADDVVKAMTAKYPSLKLPVILELSAKAAFGG